MWNYDLLYCTNKFNRGNESRSTFIEDLRSAEESWERCGQWWCHSLFWAFDWWRLFLIVKSTWCDHCFKHIFIHRILALSTLIMFGHWSSKPHQSWVSWIENVDESETIIISETKNKKKLKFKHFLLRLGNSAWLFILFFLAKKKIFNFL